MYSMVKSLAKYVQGAAVVVLEFGFSVYSFYFSLETSYIYIIYFHFSSRSVPVTRPCQVNQLVVSFTYTRPGTPALQFLGTHFTFCSVEVVIYSVSHSNCVFDQCMQRLQPQLEDFTVIFYNSEMKIKFLKLLSGMKIILSAHKSMICTF